ncbi:MAG: metallophosphoesterase [Oscillospiraceae bacterium]|nr:metallophosphoesterase [Oscillospiraceae bacterium]
MAQFTDFIPQNVAPSEANEIGVYSASGKKVCSVELSHLAFPSNAGTKLYSFGALSDVHISQDTAEADFRRALTYFQDTANVDFVCIAGDLTQYSEAAEWELYAQCVAEESESTPVYAIAGNHDGYGITVTDAFCQEHFGYGVFHTFTQGDDVFIMMSNACYPSESGNLPPFYTSSLQALCETLEANRNKRCFVFQHYFMVGTAGDPLDAYGSTTLFGTQETVIQSLMKHYPNALWFHGHSHQMFEVQTIHDKATYDFDFGCHNIHIPSCALPVQITESGSRIQLSEGSQGYVVDVYNNGIHLKGRDFSNGVFLPIASYWLDTTLQTVEAGTYTDSTGTITP